MVVRIKLLSPLECKGHTLLQLLQRGFYRMLTIILMAKKKTETNIPHDCSNRGEIYVPLLLKVKFLLFYFLKLMIMGNLGVSHKFNSTSAQIHH